jgi:outer membrane protein OmpA-like peptidoglycan-associated protein
MNLKTIAVLVVAQVGLTACANMSDGQRAALIGAGIGTVAGAATTSAVSKGDGKSTRKGAVAGAAIGALGGYIWSTRMQAQKEKMQRETAGSGIEVSQTEDNRLKLEVPSDISFDTGRDNIRPKFQNLLDSFAVTLRNHSATQIDIVGHTDSTGSDSVNEPLSVRRAESTRNYLASRGVSSNRIAVDGMGSRNPIADNATRTGRATNRRVEIYVAEQAQQ